MLCFCITKNENAPFPRPFGATGNDAQNFMRSGICLYSWCTVPRMKFVFCLSARGVQFGFLLKLFAWKGKVSGMSTKFVFVTGGVVSGLGKGICAASLGRLLKQRGVRVRNQKFDPYINVDPGTMSPYQHGEVFVTEDGAETDLDLGHYERFVDEDLTGNSSVSSGKIYWSVLNRERRGDYLGATVQIIPHITDEIKRRIALDSGRGDRDQRGGGFQSDHHGAGEIRPFVGTLLQRSLKNIFDLIDFSRHESPLNPFRIFQTARQPADRGMEEGNGKSGCEEREAVCLIYGTHRGAELISIVLHHNIQQVHQLCLCL